MYKDKANDLMNYYSRLLVYLNNGWIEFRYGTSCIIIYGDNKGVCCVDGSWSIWPNNINRQLPANFGKMFVIHTNNFCKTSHGKYLLKQNIGEILREEGL